MNKIVEELKKDHSVIAAYLFGSHQTKKQTPLSDIDICLFTKNSDRKTILNLASYGTDKIDISIFDSLPIYVKPEIFKGKPLFIKDKQFIASKFAVSFREYQDFKRYQQKYWKELKKKIKKR